MPNTYVYVRVPSKDRLDFGSIHSKFRWRMLIEFLAVAAINQYYWRDSVSHLSISHLIAGMQRVGAFANTTGVKLSTGTGEFLRRMFHTGTMISLDRFENSAIIRGVLNTTITVEDGQLSPTELRSRLEKSRTEINAAVQIKKST